ncbi:MAG: zinc finger-like domain-containing protein [Bacteroidales bacterium]|nr:zinc finger-like domain-containing protein [Bacteroidales bacterium]
MKSKKVLSIITMLFLIAQSSILFTSCGTDEGDGLLDGNESILELLKSHKWYLYDEDLYTWGDNNLSYDQTNVWMYFTSDDDGFTRTVSRSDDSALGYSKHEDIDRFTYTLSGNIVKIYSSKYGSTSLTLKGNTLGGYKAQSLTNDDYVLIANTMGERSDLGEDYLNTIKKNAVITFNEKEHYINIKSNLIHLFPNKKIEYLLEYECYKRRDNTPFYSDSKSYKYSGSTSTGENIECGWKCAIPNDAVDATMCTNSMKSIERKYENGEWLDYSEYELYEDCANILFQIIMKYADIDIRLYIVVGGVKVLVLETSDYLDNYTGKYSVTTCKTCNGTGAGNSKYSSCSTCHGSKYLFKINDDGGNTGGTTSNTTGKENGHEWVDLGLSVKWATMNVGATTASGYGEYYAWGETSSKSNYDWSTYKWSTGNTDHLTKYCTSSRYGTVDDKRTLTLDDDAAHVNWGGKWRIPTNTEIKELFRNSTWKWTTQNGIKGIIVTSKINGNSIFLPAAGDKGQVVSFNIVNGSYWSSSLNTGEISIHAYSLAFYSSTDEKDLSDYSTVDFRHVGKTIRAVCP